MILYPMFLFYSWVTCVKLTWFYSTTFKIQKWKIHVHCNSNVFSDIKDCYCTKRPDENTAWCFWRWQYDNKHQSRGGQGGQGGAGFWGWVKGQNGEPGSSSRGGHGGREGQGY